MKINKENDVKKIGSCRFIFSLWAEVNICHCTQFIEIVRQKTRKTGLIKQYTSIHWCVNKTEPFELIVDSIFLYLWQKKTLFCSSSINVIKINKKKNYE